MRKALVRCQQDGIGDVLLASAARLSSPARWRQVNFERYSAGRCFSTSILTSASVVSSMTSAMMIGRGNGRDQFALGGERSSQGRIYSIWMDEPFARKSSPAALPALKCICPGKQVPFYCPVHGGVENPNWPLLKPLAAILDPIKDDEARRIASSNFQAGRMG